MTTQTVQEVYTKIMVEAQHEKDYWQKQVLKARDTTDSHDKAEYLVEADIHLAMSQAFYQAAGWLEQTEEINPTKK